MKHKLTAVFLALTLTALCACETAVPPTVPENTESDTFPEPTVITTVSVTKAPAKTTAPPETTPAETAETEKPPEVYPVDKIEYLMKPDYDNRTKYSVRLNGKEHEIDYRFGSNKLDTHFFLDGNTLYMVCTDSMSYVSGYGKSKNSSFQQSHCFYSGEIPADGEIKMTTCEIYSSENISAVAELYDRLNKISPSWAFPKGKRTDFIACGSFISGNCKDLTDEEYLQSNLYADRPDDYGVTEEENEKARAKAESIIESYTLYITPKNIGELSKLDGAVIENLYCFLSEDGLDLSPLEKAKFNALSDFWHYAPSSIFVHGKPKLNDFIYKIDNFEGGNWRLSEVNRKSDDYRDRVYFYNCDVVFDSYLPNYYGMYNCDITLESPNLGGSARSVSYVDCRFNMVPDFSGMSFFVGATNPWCDFDFNCPGQKAIGIDRIENGAATSLIVRGNVDFSNFKFLTPLFGHEYTYIKIETTGKINFDDLIENDYSDGFFGIHFVDCITKEQFDKLVEKYPDKTISAEIDGVEYRHG